MSQQKKSNSRRYLKKVPYLPSPSTTILLLLYYYYYTTATILLVGVGKSQNISELDFFLLSHVMNDKKMLFKLKSLGLWGSLPELLYMTLFFIFSYFYKILMYTDRIFSYIIKIYKISAER